MFASMCEDKADKKEPQYELVNLYVCALFFAHAYASVGSLPEFFLQMSLAFLPLRSTASPLPILADAYFSSVKITEKVEQHAEPKCN